MSAYGELYSELALGNKLKLTHGSKEEAVSFNTTFRNYHMRHKAELEFLDSPTVLSIKLIKGTESSYEYCLIKQRTSLALSLLNVEVIPNE